VSDYGKPRAIRGEYMSTQEKPRDRVMALPEELRKELLYLAHLDPEKQKSTLFHNVAVSGERIQALIDSAKREGAIEELKKLPSNRHESSSYCNAEFFIDSEDRWKRIKELEQSEESK